MHDNFTSYLNSKGNWIFKKKFKSTVVPHHNEDLTLL